MITIIEEHLVTFTAFTDDLDFAWALVEINFTITIIDIITTIVMFIIAMAMAMTNFVKLKTYSCNFIACIEAQVIVVVIEGKTVIVHQEVVIIDKEESFKEENQIHQELVLLKESIQEASYLKEVDIGPSQALLLVEEFSLMASFPDIINHFEVIHSKYPFEVYILIGSLIKIDCIMAIAEVEEVSCQLAFSKRLLENEGELDGNSCYSPVLPHYKIQIQHYKHD